MWKGIMLMLIFFQIQNSLGQNAFHLPPKPGPENDKTLLGTDSNKNGVRDDVEIFIYEKLSKHPELFKAYLSFAKTEQNLIKYYPDINKVRANEKNHYRDLECISAIEREVGNAPIGGVSRIIELTFNTKAREKVERWYAENQNKISTDYVVKKNKPTKKEVCRF